LNLGEEARETAAKDLLLNNKDLKALDKLQHNVNVVKYALNDLHARRVKLKDCHILDNIKLRENELQRFKTKLGETEEKINVMRDKIDKRIKAIDTPKPRKTFL